MKNKINLKARFGKNFASAQSTVAYLKDMNEGESMMFVGCPDGKIRTFTCVEVRDPKEKLKGDPQEISSGTLKTLSAREKRIDYIIGGVKVSEAANNLAKTIREMSSESKDIHQKEFTAQYLQEMPDKECEYCGSTVDVSFQENPYEYEINGDDSNHWICSYCYNQQRDEI